MNIIFSDKIYRVGKGKKGQAKQKDPFIPYALQTGTSFSPQSETNKLMTALSL